MITEDYSDKELAAAINDFLGVSCWTIEQVAEWRSLLDGGYLPGYRNFDGKDYPVIEGEEHSNLNFVWFLEDEYHNN